MNCTLGHLVDGVEVPCISPAVAVISDGTNVAHLCADAYSQWNAQPGDASHLSIVEYGVVQ